MTVPRFGTTARPYGIHEMQSQINVSVPTPLRPTTASVRQNFIYAKQEIEALMDLAGGGMQGPQGPAGPVGPAGPAGQAATVDVIDTNTIAAGGQASVVPGGTAQARTLTFNIPRGDKGDPGNPGDISSMVDIAVNDAITALLTTLDARYVRRAD